MSTAKVTGLAKACKEMREISSHTDGRKGIVYMDTSTGEVWCNEYADQNSWSEYHDAAIIYLPVGQWPIVKTAMRVVRAALAGCRDEDLEAVAWARA
jgi:hypothetical protein